MLVVEVFTVREVAALLKVSTATVYKLADLGELKASRVGASLRFTRAVVEAFLAKPG